MLGTFLLGIAAGFLAPHAEPHIKKFLEGILLDEVPVEPKEMALLSFSLCILAAAVLATILFRAHAGPLALGAALGVFGPRIWAKIQSRKKADYGSDDELAEAADDAAEKVEDVVDDASDAIDDFKNKD